MFDAIALSRRPDACTSKRDALSWFVLTTCLSVLAGCSTESLAQSDDSKHLSPSTTSSTAALVATIATAAPSAAVLTGRPSDPATSACNEQSAQDFLIRAHVNRAPKNRDELAEQRRLRALSIAYRTKHYGYFKGFGTPSDHPNTTKEMSEPVHFFDIPVVLNRRIIPAIKCVEETIRRECASSNYKPYILSGLRRKNTYFDGEVSNHVYGIALDIDPQRNPCCHCVTPWNDSPLCKGDKPVWERMGLPRCWVEVFERFGFYWLGHDVLEDTMHFEFLGDPAQILRK